MKEPVARTLAPETTPDETLRTPRAYEAEAVGDGVEADPFGTEAALDDIFNPAKRPNIFARIFWIATGILVTMGLGLAHDMLLRDLFAIDEYLGWFGVGVVALFCIGLFGLIVREIVAVRRLRNLDDIKKQATEILESKIAIEGRRLLREIDAIYAHRPDLARARQTLKDNRDAQFDGDAIIEFAERTLMASLDERAKALTAASAGRVALVTAVSPRALIDLAFVAYESVRLAGAIAALYGARPGVLGYWRLAGSVLGHLAVTGGLAITDGLMEQVIGQSSLARFSVPLGQGLVNGLMTVRVGIAAMRVVRPLPFSALKQPMVRDFIAGLGKVTVEQARGYKTARRK